MTDYIILLLLLSWYGDMIHCDIYRIYDIMQMIQPIPLGVTFSNTVSKLKAQSSKLERLFSLKRGKRDFRALSFELSKMTLQVGLAVYNI